MVNKAALGILAVVVIAVVGVGMLVGTVMNGGGDAPANGDDDGGAEGPAANGTTTPTAGNSTTTATSPEGEARTPIIPRRFESSLVARNISRFINDARESEGLDPVRRNDATAHELGSMALNYSRDMADEGDIAHDVKETNVSQRYREYGLFDRCTYDDGTNIRHPGNTDRYEVIGFGTIGQYHEDGGNRTFIENESQAAQIIVEDWLEDPTNRERLMTRRFNHVGVGVEITQASGVYATANMCP